MYYWINHFCTIKEASDCAVGGSHLSSLSKPPIQGTNSIGDYCKCSFPINPLVRLLIGRYVRVIGKENAAIFLSARLLNIHFVGIITFY